MTFIIHIPTTTDYTHLSAHMIFTKIDHMLDYKKVLSRFKKTKILQKTVSEKRT